MFHLTKIDCYKAHIADNNASVMYNSSVVSAEIGTDVYSAYSGMTGAHGHLSAGVLTLEGHSDTETDIFMGKWV